MNMRFKAMKAIGDALATVRDGTPPTPENRVAQIEALVLVLATIYAADKNLGPDSIEEIADRLHVTLDATNSRN